MKLCLGTYLKILVQYSSYEQKEIVGKIMHYLSAEFVKINDKTYESKISNLVNGRKNPSKEIIKMAQDIKDDEYDEIAEYFKSVIEMLDPNKDKQIRSAICDVVMKDYRIKNSTVVDLVSGTTKDRLELEDTDLNRFLSGIFLYVMKYTKNVEKNEDSNEDVKELTDEYFVEIDKRIKKIEESIIKDVVELANQTSCINRDEEVELSARKFCIEHEENVELLPLCQIAYFINPCHKNIREIYTDYNTCSSKVRKRILELNKLPELDFSDKNWINRCIGLYEKKIVEMQLTTINFWYEGTKYLQRAYEKYSECKIEEFEPYIFDRIAKSETIDKLMDGKELKAALGDYIADYLYYKDNRTKQKLIPPWDKVWDVCNLSNCPEYEVTFWVCKFIIDSCYFIDPIVFPKKSDIQVHAETNQINIHLGDSECLIDTQEDMYYYALLQLYKCFYNK